MCTENQKRVSTERLSTNLQQLWVLCNRKSEEHLAAAVRLVLPVQGVETVLEDDESVGRIARSHVGDHWTLLERGTRKVQC